MQTAAAQSPSMLDEPATQVSVNGSHSCALTSGGGVKCWGSNSSGQLGDNTTTQRLVPVEVTGLASGVVAISAGQTHTCALTSLGAVKCWGSNTSGQLGDSTTTQRLTPVDVSGLGGGVAAIIATGNHTCALTTTGGMKCWGLNSNGELGDNSTTNRSSPVNVSGLSSGVLSITGAVSHTCALTTAGAVKCWGSNFYGQIGDNSTTNRLTPVDVSGLGSGVAAITGSGAHSCALTTTGGVKCWGLNSSGELGDNSTTQRLIPTDVSGLGSGVAAINAGGSHACALTTANIVNCWGYNSLGELGDYSTTNRSVPIAIRSGQSITFAPPATVASGSTVTITGATGGLCGVRASQPGAAPLPAGNVSFAPAPQQLRLLRITAAQTNLDIDDSAPITTYDAASDGVLLIRYLLGYRDGALTAGVISPSARRDATQVAAYIAAHLLDFDVDGDGQTRAATDGVMILRRLLGFTDPAAITQGVKNSNRSNADVVLAIEALMP